MIKPGFLVTVSLFASACTTTAEVDLYFEEDGATSGASVATNTNRLTGCNGRADSVVPADGRYVITTFGGPGDHQPMSCGGYADGTGWYAASRQRYGCAGRVKIEANGKCAVVETKDYGPDVCVERAVGMPIIDVSPKVSRHLFNESGAGWSDRLVVTVTPVAATAALGPCVAGGGTPPPPTGAGCTSATLGRDVAEGVCVQGASDAKWYSCESGAWVAQSSSAGCAEAYGFCSSATLGIDVAARTCVQSASSNNWFQCNGQGWVSPVDVGAQTGPIGACSVMHPL